VAGAERSDVQVGLVEHSGEHRKEARTPRVDLALSQDTELMYAMQDGGLAHLSSLLRVASGGKGACSPPRHLPVSWSRRMPFGISSSTTLSHATRRLTDRRRKAARCCCRRAGSPAGAQQAVAVLWVCHLAGRGDCPARSRPPMAADRHLRPEAGAPHHQSGVSPRVQPVRLALDPGASAQTGFPG